MLRRHISYCIVTYNKQQQRPEVSVIKTNRMVYISGGQVTDSRSPWRLSIFSEYFWGIVNFVALFFQTMFSPNMTKRGNNYTTDYRAGNDGGGGGGGGPRRRMGGFRRDGAPAPPPAAGGG